MRARLLVSGILTVLVAASGAVIDARLTPRAEPRASADGVQTGAWFCPHGGLWRTWILIGNPGEATATIRVSTFGSRGVAQEQSFDLAGGEDRTVEVPADAAGSGSMVEWFGAPVAAGWVSQDDAGVAAEACRSSAGRTWYVANGDTRQGRDSWLVVMNPFAEAAAFDVTLLTADSAPTKVGELRGFVLKAHRTVTFRLSKYKLEPSVAAVVEATLGSVSVAQLGSIAGVGIDAVEAVPHPARRWVLPGSFGRPGATLAVSSPNELTAAFSVREQTGLEQRPVDGLEDVSLRGPSVRVYDTASERGVTGIVVDVTGKVPVVAARRTLGPSDVGALSGASTESRSWVIPPTVPPSGGEQRLMLENPGQSDVTVRVRLFGRLGTDLGDVVVPAGRTVTVTLAAGLEDGPVWATAIAERGTFVAGSASVSLGGRGYAVSIGLPLTP